MGIYYRSIMEGTGEDGNEYRWEGGYEKTWESIQEDKDGMLDISVQVPI